MSASTPRLGTPPTRTIARPPRRVGPGAALSVRSFWWATPALAVLASSALPDDPPPDPVEAFLLGRGALLVCDSSADRVLAFRDTDRSGTIEDEIPAGGSAEISVFYDDSSSGPDLSTPSHLATDPAGALYLLDGGTLDQVLILSDRNRDGDANDPGEIAVFYDASSGGPAISTPNSIVRSRTGLVYLSDDGARSRRLLRLEDLDGDGNALGDGEARVAHDASSASGLILDAVEALALTPEGTLFAADSLLRAIVRLDDLDGDGVFQTSGEARPHYSYPADAPDMVVEALFASGDSLYAADKAAGVVLRLRDLDGDGDADDEGEATAFVGPAGSSPVGQITDLIALEDGFLVLLDNSSDSVWVARDLDGDGDALAAGETYRWLRDDGKSLALPSGIAWCPDGDEQPPLPPSFVRGDASGDGRLDISDPIAILGLLFLGGASPACEDAVDVDDNGDLNISDPIFGLNYLFLGGQAPPEPFPGPGADPTGDTLSC